MFTMASHIRCNRLANRLIDGRLNQCTHVRSARAALALVDPRTGEPYVHQMVGETMMTAEWVEGDSPLELETALSVLSSSTRVGFEGAKVRLVLGSNSTETRFLGNPVLAGDGMVTHCRNSNPNDVFEENESGGERLMILVQAASPCTHGPYLWGRLAAKVGLCLLARLFEVSALGKDEKFTAVIDWRAADLARDRLIENGIRRFAAAAGRGSYVPWLHGAASAASRRDEDGG